MSSKEIIELIERRINDLYQTKETETDKDELLKLEGKISELLYLKSTIEVIENK